MDSVMPALIKYEPLKEALFLPTMVGKVSMYTSFLLNLLKRGPYVSGFGMMRNLIANDTFQFLIN